MRRLSAVVCGAFIAASACGGGSTPPAQEHDAATSTQTQTAPAPTERVASAAWSPIENERVRVVAVPVPGDGSPTSPTSSLPTVSVTLDGNVAYADPPGATSAFGGNSTGGYFVRVELKDKRVAAFPNPSQYPLAFPRPNVKKVLENDRVMIWDYTWTPGEPTPMHFHDKDVVVIYLEDGELKSTEPNGQSVVNPHYFGFTKFNPGNRVHTEELIKGKGRAIITELK